MRIPDPVPRQIRGDHHGEEERESPRTGEPLPRVRRNSHPVPGNRSREIALEEDLETEGQYGLIGGLRTTSPLRFQRSFLEPGDSSNGKKLISLAGQLFSRWVFCR